MNDPFNQLPTDPEWLRKAHAIAESASRELGCFVLLVAAQNDGKLACITEGTPETGPLAEAFSEGGAPALLGSLALTIMVMQAHEKTRARS